MHRILMSLAVGVFLFGSPNAALADIALSQAKARLACGAGTVVASQFLPNGSLQVTCSAPSNASSTALQGTGLATPVGSGALITALILVVVTGGAETTTTTTTTTGSFGDNR